MGLTIEQAMDFFREEKVQKPLQSMMDVGLGYLTLGQPTSTLSGGEIQRSSWPASFIKKEISISWTNRPQVCMKRTWKPYYPCSGVWWSSAIQLSL